MAHDYDRLRGKLPIDILRLDQELLEMPVLVQDAAEAAAKLHEDERIARHALDVVKAEEADRLRTVDSKISETKISSQILGLQPVIDARDAYDRVQYEAEVAGALVSSLREKSRLLQKICDMILAGFITPSSAYESRRTQLRQRGGN